MDFLPLSLVFLGAGLFSLLYGKIVPDKETLKKRLPNKISGAGIILWLVICLTLYFIIKNNQGFARTTSIFTLLFALLVFETFFLFLLRWLKSNLIAVILALFSAAVLFFLHLSFPTFTLRNIIIILATLGASTLLIRLDWLKTWLMFTLAFLWTGYDIYTTRYFLPHVLSPVTEPPKIFFFPAVITGTISLGSGDFIFLILFTLVIQRQFGWLPAIILVAAENVGLLITGFFYKSDAIVPFLAIMTPIFLLIYFISYLKKK